MKGVVQWHRVACILQTEREYGKRRERAKLTSILSLENPHAEAPRGFLFHSSERSVHDVAPFRGLKYVVFVYRSLVLLERWNRCAGADFLSRLRHPFDGSTCDWLVVGGGTASRWITTYSMLFREGKTSRSTRGSFNVLRLCCMGVLADN